MGFFLRPRLAVAQNGVEDGEQWRATAIRVTIFSFPAAMRRS
jgi:hypothetical protein